MISRSVSDAEEETIRDNAPPSSALMQELKVMLQRVSEEWIVRHITAPPPLFFVMDVKDVLESESAFEKEEEEEELSVESENEKRE